MVQLALPPAVVPDRPIVIAASFLAVFAPDLAPQSADGQDAQ